MQSQDFARVTPRDLAKAKRLARRALRKDAFDSASARFYVKQARALEIAMREQRA